MVPDLIVFLVIALGALFILTLCVQLHRYFTRIAPRYDEEVLDTVLQVMGTKPVPQHNQYRFFVVDVSPSNDLNTSQLQDPKTESLERKQVESPPAYEMPPAYDGFGEAEISVRKV